MSKMPLKLLCDVCCKEIPPASKDVEPVKWNTGLLVLADGEWQEPDHWWQNKDMICKECTEALKKAIDDKIEELRGRGE